MQVKKSVSSLFICEGQKYSAIPYKESIPKPWIPRFFVLSLYLCAKANSSLNHAINRANDLKRRQMISY